MMFFDTQHGKDWGWAVWSAHELAETDLVSYELVNGFFAFPVPTVQLIMAEDGRLRFARVRANGGVWRARSATSCGSFADDLDAFRGVLSSMAEWWCA